MVKFMGFYRKQAKNRPTSTIPGTVPSSVPRGPAYPPSGGHAISLLDGPLRLAYNNLVRLYALITRAYSSAVEPPAHNRLVLGSIPSGPTKLQRLLPRRRTRYSTTQKYDDPIPEIAGRRIFFAFDAVKRADRGT